jgi:hydrogenase maturation protease
VNRSKEGTDLRLGVVGLGSVIQGDDGAGPAAVALLEATWELPKEVHVVDLGTPGPYLADHLINYDMVVLLDTVRAKAKPGTVVRYGRHQLLATCVAGPRVSPHDPGVGEALRQLAFQGVDPEVVLIGVVPLSNSAGTELSATVERALPEMVSAVIAELEQNGCECRRRESPEEPRWWWSRGLASSHGMLPSS